jgi:hypothetical protein
MWVIRGCRTGLQYAFLMGVCENVIVVYALQASTSLLWRIV